jgi:FkbM family methyltransferase
MKVLVYIGLNECWTLNQLLPYFDRVIALDPLPRTKNYIDPLLKKYSHLEFYPYAADTEYKKTNFNISPASGCSSSLLNLNTQDVIPKDINDWKTIEVECVDIYDFLKNKLKIKKIDLYISDIQGYDYTILDHLSSYINDKKIDNLMVETMSDNLISTYQNSKNQFTNFYNLLKHNYNLIQIEHDSRPVTQEEYTDIIDMTGKNKLHEFDTIWSIKT